MTTITIRLPEKLLHDMDCNAHAAHMARAEYVRRAIENMNMVISKNVKAKQLQKASLRVREESMRINKEFSDIEHDPKD